MTTLSWPNLTTQNKKTSPPTVWCLLIHIYLPPLLNSCDNMVLDSFPNLIDLFFNFACNLLPCLIPTWLFPPLWSICQTWPYIHVEEPSWYSCWKEAWMWPLFPWRLNCSQHYISKLDRLTENVIPANWEWLASLRVFLTSSKLVVLSLFEEVHAWL